MSKLDNILNDYFRNTREVKAELPLNSRIEAKRQVKKLFLEVVDSSEYDADVGFGDATIVKRVDVDELRQKIGEL